MYFLYKIQLILTDDHAKYTKHYYASSIDNFGQYSYFMPNITFSILFTCLKLRFGRFGRADYIIALHLYCNRLSNLLFSPSQIVDSFARIINNSTMGIGRVLVIAGSDSSGGALVPRHPLLRTQHLYPTKD